MATDEEMRGSEKEMIINNDDETREIDEVKSIESGDSKDEERGIEKEIFIDNDNIENKEQGKEKETFVDNDTDDENSDTKHDIIMNWIMVKDWYKVPLKPGEKSSFARRLDTKFATQFYRASILLGALFKITTVALLIGYSPSVSILRTVPGPNNNYDLGKISQRFPHNESKSCDEIFEEKKPSASEFIISFANSTTSSISSCPDESFDEFLRKVAPYVMIMIVVAWFVLKVFLSQVQETTKRTQEADMGCDCCLYDSFVSCFRIIGGALYLLMDVALQTIIAPLASLNLKRQSSAIWVGVYNFLLLQILLVAFAIACAVIVLLILFEAVLRFICPIRCCGDWKYPIGSLGRKVGYYLLMVCLFSFVCIAIPLNVLTMINIVNEHNTCGYSITIDGDGDGNVITSNSGCDLDILLDIIWKILGDIFSIPSEWWPQGLTATSYVVNTFNIAGAFSIAPSILLSFVGILAHMLDGLVYICKCLCLCC